MHYPHVFGAVLAESPSLWIAEGQFLRDMWHYRGALPERVFMGAGTLEYSATRDHVRCVLQLQLQLCDCVLGGRLQCGGVRRRSALAGACILPAYAAAAHCSGVGAAAVLIYC